MTPTVFYSWQSDIRAAACRSLILDALHAAGAALLQEGSVNVEPVIDRDTQDVPGSPDIGATIFAKIDAAAVFVADVTLVTAAGGGRPTPNPNVLVELGYALKALSDRRVLLVQNTAFGEPELLPFDLRRKRVLTYASPPDATERAAARKHLQKQLEGALRAVLNDAPSRAEVEVGLEYEVRSRTPDLHQYELVASIKNVSSRRIDDWELELEIPTALVEPGITFAAKVNAQSDHERSLFRVGAAFHRQPLHYQRCFELRIPYRVDRATYRTPVLDKHATVRALVDGKVVAEVARPMTALSCF